MDCKPFKVRVLDKRKSEHGLIFKSMRYYVTLKFVEDYGVVTERLVDIQQYHTMNVGDEFVIDMFAVSGDTYYFTQKEAIRMAGRL
jgi:hypothetical protein